MFVDTVHFGRGWQWSRGGFCSCRSCEISQLMEDNKDVSFYTKLSSFLNVNFIKFRTYVVTHHYSWKIQSIRFRLTIYIMTHARKHARTHAHNIIVIMYLCMYVWTIGGRGLFKFSIKNTWIFIFPQNMNCTVYT